VRRLHILLLAAVAALAAPAAATAATARPYSLGTQTLHVAEWDGSLHDMTVPVKGFIAVPAGTAPAGVVLIEHGSYRDCLTGGQPSDDSSYPCPAGHPEIDNAAGFAYLAARLADAGFIALSINANAAFPMDTGKRYKDGFESSTTGAWDMRAQLVARHLAALATASTGGADPFGVALAGRADMSRVGLLGHSRGGEGVVDEALRSHPGFTVRALLLISPTDFEDRTPPDVPLHVLLGTCDGDVWNLAGAGYYDRARLGTRTAPVAQTLVRGANHNWFTSAWSPGHSWSVDEAVDNPGCAGSLVPKRRPTAGRQQRIAGDVATAFFRRHLRGGPASALLGDRGLAGSVAGVRVVPSYDPPSAARLDVDRALQRAQSALGTSVRGRGLALGYRVLTTAPIGSDPAARWSPHDLSVRTIRWRRRGGRVTYALPSPDLTGKRALSLRLAVDSWASSRSATVSLDLRDAAGHRRTVRVRVATERPLTGPYRKAVLGTFRVSLRRFHGVDLRHLRSLTLRPAGRSGALLLTDVAFTTTV